MPKDKLVDERRQKINATITTGKLVRDLTEHTAWSMIIAPLLDKMLIDVLGGKNKDGTWHAGTITLDEKHSTDYYIGYRQFGIDFVNRVMHFVNSIPANELKLRQIDNAEGRKPTPAMQKSSYYPRKDEIPAKMK